MIVMFSTLGIWNWLIFGFIMMGLEVVAPGVFLVWLGLAALLGGAFLAGWDRLVNVRGCPLGPCSHQ